MKFLESKLLTFYKSSYFPIMILSLGMLLIHFVLNLDHPGDDKSFMKVLSNDHLNPLAYLTTRYHTWSSRVLIEFILIFVVHFPVVWRLLDTGMMVLIAVSISKLIPTSKSREKNWLITGLLFMYPFVHMASAGWIATTLNYIWPLALGLFSMIPIKKYLCSEKVFWYEFLFYIPALIFAANQEQLCVILLSVYVVFTVYFALIKKVNWFMIVQTIISGISFLFIITCPGNAARNVKEVTRWFPEFNTISFPRKVEMGFSSSLFEFVMKPNIIFTLFSFLLLLCVVLTHHKKILRFIAGIPFASSLVFGIFNNELGGTFYAITKAKNSMTKFGTGIRLNSVTSWVPDLLLVVISLAVLISLYFLFKNKKTSLIALFILLLGFGSRMIMSFSPTIWASGPRTFLFMYVAFIILTVLLFQIILDSKSKIFKSLSINTVTVLAILSFFNTFYTLR
ncbi:hypothetical protein J7E81_08530 [Bacillus sp. ISL-18]|uniref:DUF6056 family protein n=1 Tax=Bacillus sp. ISL-18 TaxID=2819118 RepID=UPI001BEB61E3|nr:DUF6056 family protein [Bacillus sp. ISL-18]MBT2655288.1 hypothetical protein [Bacillus sp. ISL-18]